MKILVSADDYWYEPVSAIRLPDLFTNPCRYVYLAYSVRRAEYCIITYKHQWGPECVMYNIG